MRMKFLSILPETCARTWCLFSSSTRNIAFGSGSITVAMTSMASSLEFPESPFFFSSRMGLAIISRVYPNRIKSRPLQLLPRRPGHLFRPGQNPRSVSGDRDGVLEVRRGAAICGFRHPLVAHANFRAARIHHWLDGDDHALLQPHAASLVSVVRQVGLVVHPRSDPVPDELTHHRETVLLHPALHRVADIAEPVAGAHFVDRAVQRFPGHIQQLLHFRPNPPHRDSDRGIRVVAIHFHPEIDRDDVAFAQLALRRWNTVNDLAVHRGTQHAGITTISLERRLARSSGDFFPGKLLEVHRRYSRLYRASQRGQDLVHEKAGAVHLFQLFRASQVNRHLSLFQDPYRARLSRPAHALHALQHLAADFFHTLRRVYAVQQTQAPVVSHQRRRLLLIRLQTRTDHFFTVVRPLHQLAAVGVANSFGLGRALVNIVNLAAHFAGPSPSQPSHQNRRIDGQVRSEER